MRRLSAALVTRVAIASPSDVVPERQAIHRALHDWNQSHTEKEGIVYFSYMWERDVAARAGVGGPQDVIDRKIIHNAHVLIAIFGTRLGSATSDAISGTVHEIEEGVRAGIPVHVLFSNKAIPRGTDRLELERLEKYQDSIRGSSLYREFSTIRSLKDEVEKCLIEDVHEIRNAAPAVLALAADVLLGIRLVRKSPSMLSLTVSNLSHRPLDLVRIDDVQQTNGALVRVANAGRNISLGIDDEFVSPINVRSNGSDLYRVRISWKGGSRIYSSDMEVAVAD